MKNAARIPIAALAAALTLSACTNKQGETESDVFITVDMPAQPGFVNVGVVAPIQVATITLTEPLQEPDRDGSAGVCQHHHRQLHGPLRPNGRRDPRSTGPVLRRRRGRSLRRHGDPHQLSDPARLLDPAFPVRSAAPFQRRIRSGDREGRDPDDLLHHFLRAHGRRAARPERDGDRALAFPVFGSDAAFQVRSLRGGPTCAGSPT